MGRARLVGAASLLALAAIVAVRGQEQSQRTFRGGTNLVTVDVTVLDRDGVPLRGLDADDFTVELNGEVRPVRVVDYVEFERLDEPLEIGPNRDIQPPANATQEPRVTVFVLDDLSFEPQNAKSIMTSATRFLASLRPNDLVGFATTSGEGALINPSRDHSLVETALARTTGRLADRDPDSPDQWCPPELEEFRCSCLSNMYDIIARGQLENYESIALSLGAAPVGRTLVILTRGIAPTLICGVPGTGNEGGLLRERDLSYIHPFAQAVARAGVSAYILAPEPVGMSQGDKWFTSAMLTADVAGARFERVIGQADRIFTRIRTAMSAYYRLGVEMPAGAVDSRVNVDVKVDRDDVRVESRRSTMVPEGIRAETTIEEALAAAAFRGEYWRDVPATVAVAARAGATPDELQLAIHLTVPRDVEGPVRAVIAVVGETGEVVWSGQSTLAAPTGGDDYLRSTAIAVPPGQYRVRAAVADAADRIGVADRNVTAQLHDLGLVRLSDVFTSWAGSDETYRFTLDRLPVEAELLHAEVEVYPVGAEPPADLYVRWVLTAPGGEVVVDRESDVLDEDGTLKGITELPVSDLQTGLYTLRATLVSGDTELGVVTAVFGVRS